MKIHKNIIYNIITPISLLIFCAGCESFVEIPLPDTELNTSFVFEDVATAEAAITAIYASLRDEGLLTGKVSGISHQLGVYSDELTYYGPSENLSYQFYLNNLSASDTRMESLWNYSYEQLYAANSALEGIRQSSALSEEQRTFLTGEALFLRGLIHFYLVNLYGDIPYADSTDYNQNSTSARMESTTVYQYIIEDLQTAVKQLPTAYHSPDRVRPNRAAAQSLLARVYLFQGDWQNASNMASAVLNQTDRYLLESPALTFLKGSTSTIWQLSPSQVGYNTHEASTFIFTAGPPPQSALSEDLVAAFSNEDLRKDAWIRSIHDASETWYMPYKYTLNLYEGSGMEYSKVIRLAEVYLIRAEARVQFGDLIGAVEDLNVILNRAGLEKSLATTKEAILEQIYLQSRLEFFTEHGHRYFQLKRRGALDAELSNIKPGWNSTDILWPIPDSEISLNPNLNPQNPGY